jgi:hypothetical protein
LHSVTDFNGISQSITCLALPKPVAKGGGDELDNLRPLHWENNLSKSDGKLVCVITADGDKNVLK